MLTADRNTPMTNGESIAVPMAATTEIFAGAMVCANATGYATKGAVSTTLTYLGRAEEHVNNAGADGAANILVRRKKAFKFKNHGADLVTQAELGKTCYIVDDETVAKTNGTSTRSACGIVVSVDATGVWIE
jgi:hypothetical protein